MMTNEKINKLAKETYNKYFHDNVGTHSLKDDDIVLDQVELAQEINEMKLDEEKRHESLEILREKLNIDAKKAYEKNFGKEKSTEHVHHMNVDELYKELNQQKEELLKKTQELKKDEMRRN